MASDGATGRSKRRRSAWTEVRVDVPLGWQELVADALVFGPCTTVALGTTTAFPDRGAVRTFVRSAEDTPALRAEVAERLRRLEDAVGDAELVGLVASFEPLPAEDYATSWRSSWRPFRVGRLVLLPPWREEPPPRPEDVRLSIEPGGSFGSGRHATTRTCLRLLDQRLRGGERVLDAGTGSGILCVGAALLGARECIGFDTDPASRPAAEELAAANGVADRCHFVEDDFRALDAVDGAFDVVLANIYADVLMTYGWDLGQRLTESGWFAFSGCRIDYADATREALLAADLVVDEERLRGRWMTFVGRRAR